MEAGTLALDLWRKRESKIVGVCFRRELQRKWRENNLEMLQRPQKFFFFNLEGEGGFSYFFVEHATGAYFGNHGHTQCVSIHRFS